MSAVTATEYKGYQIAFFNGAWRICGSLRFLSFDTKQLVKDYIDARIAVETKGGYI